MTQAEIARIALRQLADYDDHRPGCIFADSQFELTLDDAFAVQRQAAALRAARGEAIAGYKIGCISEAVQKQLGLNSPAFGFLFETELRPSGAVVDTAAFDSLAIEGEFAVRIAEDVPEPGLFRAAPQRFLHSVFPVIELHNNVFRRSAPTAEELIANNALNAGVIFPAAEPPFALDDLLSEAITVFRNGEPLGTSNAGAVPGGPLASVFRVAEHLSAFGRTLKRGDLVLTGSPLPLYAAGAGDSFRVIAARLGQVEMSVRVQSAGV